MSRRFRHRSDRLRHPHHRQFPRHHEGRDAYRRGRRPLHSGCHPRQADGDRRRSQRWSHQRQGGPAPPPRIGGRKRVLRLDGRRLEVRTRRCDRRHHHPLGQYFSAASSSVRHGMACRCRQAADVYTKLSVGDGLVSQIPALIVSLAAALLVSKGGTRGSTDQAVLSPGSPIIRARSSLPPVLMGLLALHPRPPDLSIRGARRHHGIRRLRHPKASRGTGERRPRGREEPRPPRSSDRRKPKPARRSKSL